jgi:hypothetical protein
MTAVMIQLKILNPIDNQNKWLTKSFISRHPKEKMILKSTFNDNNK